MDQSIVSSIFSSRAESGRYNVETRKENMHEHTGASHAAAFCLDEAENNTSTTHLEDISKKTKNYISAFKKASVLCVCMQYACMHARSTGSADQLRSKIIVPHGLYDLCAIWSFFLTNKSEVFRSSNHHSVLVMTPNQLKLCRRNENAMLNRLVPFSKGFLEK